MEKKKNTKRSSTEKHPKLTHDEFWILLEMSDELFNADISFVNNIFLKLDKSLRGNLSSADKDNLVVIANQLDAQRLKKYNINKQDLIKKIKSLK